MRQSQKLDKIHIFYARKFCRSTSGVRVLKQSCYSASIECVLVYIRSRDAGTVAGQAGAEKKLRAVQTYEKQKIVANYQACN